MKQGIKMSEPRKARDMQPVKVRHGQSLTSGLLPLQLRFCEVH